MNNMEFLVFVQCMTFNHALYIIDAMNGFTMQETTFPYVCVIIDDASTDGEPKIIQQYLEKYFDMNDSNDAYDKETDDYHFIFAHHKTNENCFFAVYFLKYNHHRTKKSKGHYWQKWAKVKYFALCEGDDYWIKKDKLQRQVDFLENNPDYSMCFHCAMEHYEYGTTQDRIFSQIENRDYSGIEIFEHWLVATASVVFRRKILQSSLRKEVINNRNFIYGDTPLFLTCASLGKIRGFNDTMSVYRRNLGGITSIQKTKDIDWLKKRAYHFLEIYKVFGDSYKKTSIRKFSILMISGFAESIKEKNLRFDFLKESLNVSVMSTIKALFWEIKKISKEFLLKKTRKTNA
jgi:glycosyltransferase involved in cell wall biosynthesis